MCRHILQSIIMALLQLGLVYAFCAFIHTTWATADGLTIIGGQNVSITEAPYMAALYASGKFACGGSIIHERFILTAAHCIRKTRSPRKVIIGADRLKADDDRVIISVQKELCHENYHPDPEVNDICLLKLYKPIPFGPKIAKIRLPKPNFRITGGMMVKVTGWGVTSEFGKVRAKVLQQVTTSTVSDRKCRHYFPNLKDTMMCAGSEGHDACYGDSGGPLTYKKFQIGVVSYGKRCGHVGGVYTKVSAYLSWINGTIEANL